MIQKILNKRNNINIVIVLIAFITLMISASFSQEAKVKKIYTVEDFMNIENDLYANYELMNDLDFTGVEFESIGDISNPFFGKFNGNGYSLKNITMIIETDSRNETYYGVFSNLSGNALINNVGIENINIDITNNGFGRVYVGGVIGYGDYNTLLINTYITGNISGVNNGYGETYIGEIGGKSNSIVFNSVVIMDTNFTVNNGYLCVGIDKATWLSRFYDYILDTSINITTYNDSKASVYLSTSNHSQSLTSIKVNITEYGESSNEDTKSEALITLENNTINSYININGDLALIESNKNYNDVNNKMFYVDELGMSDSIWDFSILDAENRIYPRLKHLK